MVSQVDMEEEKLILKGLKKKEFMSENQNENLLEIKVDQSNDFQNNDDAINHTFKMIMSAQGIKNNQDFSIEDASSDDEGEEDEDEGQSDEDRETSEDKLENLLNNGEIEPIAEEDGEESKYMPTPQKPVTSKMDGNKAVAWVKALKAKEIEKRLDLDENHDSKVTKNFKSADAQKPKATIKDTKNMTQKHLPPRIPNRSSTSNEHPKEGSIPSSYMKSYNKHVPSTTKASTVSETPKSFNHGNSSGTNPIKKSSLNDSKTSLDHEAKPDPATTRALMLYETPTVASQQKKQDVYKPEEVLPPWGIQSINSKNILAKRVTSATTRSTVTPRANNVKRGLSSVTCTALVVKPDTANKTHVQKDIKIRKHKRNRSRQTSKAATR